MRGARAKPGLELNIVQYVATLEAHWRGKYTPRELHNRLSIMLLQLKSALRENSENARIVSEALLRLARGEKLAKDYQKTADRALVELLEFFGIALISMLPGAVITLPVLYKLANHFNIRLSSSKQVSQTRQIDG